MTTFVGGSAFIYKELVEVKMSITDLTIDSNLQVGWLWKNIVIFA